MKKYHLLLLSVLSGLLFTLGWPANGFPGLLFIAFVPLFIIEDYIDKHRERFNRYSILFYAYPAFLIWNGLCTWWVWNATPGGGVGAIAVNAFFMAFVFNIYHISKRNIYPTRHAQFILIFYWIAFEYFHLNWEMNWPWLNLGNGFANYVKWIQWYEFTGTFGGTLWILVVNILIYRILKTKIEEGRTKSLKRFSVLALSSSVVLFVPLIISFLIYTNYEEESNPVNIIITQPNVDPYTEQYSLPPSVVIKRNLSEAEPYLDENTDLIVSPESAIQERIWERAVEQYRSLSLLKQFLQDYPNTSIIIGASTRKEFLPGEELSPTARKFIDVEKYYDAYNTAFYIDTGRIWQWSHKSRLTPGVESMPFPKFLEGLAIDMGGTVGSLGVDKERVVFVRASDSLKSGAAICFESIFGEFFAGFARNGAELIFVVTNDGWWGNTPGHKQHFSFSRMRAIENRRSIARSANTGISAFINQRGDVTQELGYWIPGALSQSLNTNDKLTFYTKYGDYIARISSFITAVLLLYTIARILGRSKKPIVSTK